MFSSPSTPGSPSRRSLPSLPPGLRRALPPLTAHLVVALVALVAIGGATRVMEAGLACPDWPLCYGSLLPGRQMNMQVFLEWFHRLDAFLVGVALVVLFGLSVGYRHRLPRWLLWCAGAALLLVVIQGGLGALTVIRLLAASTVTAHLVTALALVALISSTHQALEQWLERSQQDPDPAAPLHRGVLPAWWLPLVSVAAASLFAQCLLGGTMASQWAADRCLASGDACQWLLFHRTGSWIAACTVLTMATASLFLPGGHPKLRWFSVAAGSLVLAQIALGVFTLRLGLAVPAVTVAHQFVAALLIALIGAVLGRSLPLGDSFSRPTITLEASHG